MNFRALTSIIAITVLAALANPSLLAAQNPVPGAASCYSSLLASPPTLSANVQSINSDGTVVVNGVDTAGPTTPFEFFWGDGSSTSGFFPQQHVYANASQNYVINITATENSGANQQFSFTVFFIEPSITQHALPGVSFQIPSQPVQLQTHYPYPPPTDVTVFSDSSFPVYSRSDVAYILASAASIDYDFANNNSFLLNGVFSIDMLENTTFGGGFSFWYTTPMSVGFGPTILNTPIGWNVLFNEIGKDTALNTPMILPFGGNTDGNASEIYSETMGDIFSYAAGCQLISNPSLYGLGDDVVADIRSSMLVGAANLQGTFNAYVAAGAPFSSWNPYNGGPDPTLGTISALSWKFIEHAEKQGKGYQIPAKRLMTFLQMFDGSMLASYAPTSNIQAAATFRSTLMVTALSYAFSEDLRSEFRSLNFPLDDETFQQLYEMVTGGGASLVPSTAAFAIQEVGTSSAGKTFTLTNYLLTPISISASFGGANPNDFPVQASSTCPYPTGMLAANSGCTYVIAFAPSVNGAESSTFSVADTDGTRSLANSPQIINLTGTGLSSPGIGLTGTGLSSPGIGWRVLYVDSEATDCGNYGATNAIDGNPGTMWMTEWCHGSPPTPHEIQIDLGANYTINGFQYLPRQDAFSSGNIANYEFYVSADGANWGTAVSTGTLMASASDHTQKQVSFPGTAGRYVRLRGMTEVTGGPWTNVAEFNVLGSAVATSGPQVASVTLNPASIAGGGIASTATVTLTSAPLTNATVTLASSNPAAATVPATVTVNAGTTTANFTVTSASSGSTTALSVINASYNGSTGAALLTVTPGFSSTAVTIPRSGWRVQYVDSEATDCGNYGATNAIDGNPATMWITEWCHGAPATPHEIQIDLGDSYTIAGFQYLPRQDNYSSGNIANYEFYVSADGVNWGTAVASGKLMPNAQDRTQKLVTFTGVVGRYVRLRALSEVSGGPWTNAAEINVLGTVFIPTIPTSGWQLLYADSQATDCGNYGATNAFDGNPATMWITEWCHGAPTTPHEIQIDLGASYTIRGFQYLPRQDNYSSGNIASYEFYVSADGVNWGTAVSTGTLMANSSDKTQKKVTFTGVIARYVRLRALTEVNGGPWTNAAEINVLGSAVATGSLQVAGVAVTPTSIAAGGNTSTGSVTLTNAPLTDTSVTLSSGNPAVATVPGTVTVNAGTKTASFTVTSASTVNTTVTSVIGAALNGSSGTATLTVTPVALAPITQSGWRVLYVDSQATDCGNYGATNAFDGIPGTMWLTEWCHGAPPMPHEIQIDLGGSYPIAGFQYLPRQDPFSSGNIANYEFYVSTDGVNWGTAVSTGTLMTSAADKSQKQVTFPGTAGRYVRLRALTEVNGGPWTNMAELNVLAIPAWSGILAPSRAINWSAAGVTGGIPNRTTVCATLDPYEGSADAINTAIANCPSGQVVYLNAGIYHLFTGIVMQENVTLRGAGADQTFLVFAGSNAEACAITPTDICFQKNPLNYSSSEIQPGGSNSATWTAGYAKGTTQITLSNIGSSGLSVGQYIFLDQANDISDNGSLIICDATSPFACSAQGGSPGRTVNGVDRNQIQIVQITACTPSCTSGSTFTITPGLYADNWSAAKNPGAWWMSTIQFAGLENLSMDHSFAGFPTGGAVVLAGAMNSWIKGVRSISLGDYRNHVWLFQSAHNTVQDSYFYGASGTSLGYGIESRIASDDLMMNNIFQHVTTPLLAGTAEGDVYGYNFSIDDYYSAGPSFLSQSTDTHGAGSIYNLFEGNNGNGFRADVIHGTSGLDTLFRNRYNGWESGKTQQLNPIIINSYNRYENLIGNVLGQTGVQTAYQNSDVPIYNIGSGDCCDGAVVADDLIVVSTMMRWGNYDTVNGANRFLASEVPSGIGAYANTVPASDSLPPSFFLNAKPSWWGTVPWPAVGPDVTGGDIPNIDGHAYNLPAQLCYNNATKDANGILIDFNADRCYAAASGPPGSSALAVTPTPPFFGDVVVGNTLTKTIAISNPGTATTIVFNGTASGTEFAVFSPTFPLTLAAGANQLVTISFSPQSIGPITGVVTFTSNAASSPVVSLGVSGNGTAPITCFTVAPTDVSFGTVILGFTSLQGVTLFNTGNTSLTLSSTTVTGDGYSVTSPGLPITIPVGFSQPITISFTPPGAGPSLGTLTFNTDATCTPTPPVASLTGTGGFASGHTATLNWTASTTAVSYNVYRSTTSGSLFQKINSVPVTATTFVDSSLASGQTYFWVMTAVDGSGLESSFSTQVFATIP